MELGDPSPQAGRSVEDRLRGFILREVLRDEARELPLDAPLLTGLLDSLGLVQLLEFLEERLGVAVANQDVVDENFGTLRTLTAFVQSHQASGRTEPGR